MAKFPQKGPKKSFRLLDFLGIERQNFGTISENKVHSRSNLLQCVNNNNNYNNPQWKINRKILTIFDFFSITLNWSLAIFCLYFPKVQRPRIFLWTFFWMFSHLYSPVIVSECIISTVVYMCGHTIKISVSVKTCPLLVMNFFILEVYGRKASLGYISLFSLHAI